LAKFKKAVREFETDDSEKRFNERLGKIAKSKPDGLLLRSEPRLKSGFRPAHEDQMESYTDEHIAAGCPGFADHRTAILPSNSGHERSDSQSFGLRKVSSPSPRSSSLGPSEVIPSSKSQ
jgi:hypothetical protein